MSTRTTPPSGDERRRGEASGTHQGLNRPADDQRARQRLGDIGGDATDTDAFEDELRDRGGRGRPSTADVRSDQNDDERSERR